MLGGRRAASSVALVCLAVAQGAGLVACTTYGETEAPSASDAGGPSPPSGGDGGGGSTSTLSTPGKVECGDALCDLSASYCCITPKDGQPSFSCVPNESECDANRARCDESADCAAGESCCATLSLGKFATICDTRCTISQSCRTDAECPEKKCIKQRCTGFVAHLCGKNPFCEAL